MSMPSSRIPKPKMNALVLTSRSQRSLIAQMGLRDDRRFYEKFKETVEKLAKEYLDYTIPFHKQRQWFLDVVSSRLPALRRYEELWPVEVYLRLYLYNTPRPHTVLDTFLSLKASKARTMSRSLSYVTNARASPSFKRETSELENSLNFIQRSQPIEDFLNSLSLPQPGLLEVFIALGINDAETFDAFARLLRADEWLAELVNENQLTLLQKSLVYEGLCKYVRDRPPAATSGPEFCSENVAHNFLMTLRPPLPHLIPVFQRLGIHDQPTLFASARMVERDAYFERLARWGAMTPLEARIIGEGMADIKRLNRVSILPSSRARPLVVRTVTEFSR